MRAQQIDMEIVSGDNQMDFSHAFGIEHRVVNDAEYQGQPVRLVEGSRLYATDIEDLWHAITNIERIPRWFAPVSGELRLGGRYQIEGNAGGEITTCDRPKSFSLTWECGENMSWVKVMLESEANGTWLILEHRMSKDEASEKHWKKYGPGATGVGWELGFTNLGLYIKSGDPVVESEAHAWLTSSSGMAFIEKSAKAWGEAHVRAGEDQSTAQAMAAETAKFYCGG